MLVPLALAYTLMSRLKVMTKVFLAYCGVAMLVGIAVSLSRGGMAAAAAGLIVFCVTILVQRGHGLPALALVVGLAAIGVCFGADFAGLSRRIENTFQSGELTDFRPYYWLAAVQIFRDHPLWGVGPGHFDSAYARYRATHVQTRPVYAHNDYLNTLSEWGLTGADCIIAVATRLAFCRGARGAWKAWVAIPRVDPDTRKSVKSDKVAFIMGACMALVALMVHSLVDFNMHVLANAAIAVTFMALIAAHWRFATERGWKEQYN